MEKILNRITINPDVLHGKPCIRNMKFSISQLLQLFSSGMTEEEILNDYNFLEKEDIQAYVFYASK